MYVKGKFSFEKRHSKLHYKRTVSENSTIEEKFQKRYGQVNALACPIGRYDHLFKKEFQKGHHKDITVSRVKNPEI